MITHLLNEDIYVINIFTSRFNILLHSLHDTILYFKKFLFFYKTWSCDSLKTSLSLKYYCYLTPKNFKMAVKWVDSFVNYIGRCCVQNSFFYYKALFFDVPSDGKLTSVKVKNNNASARNFMKTRVQYRVTLPNNTKQTVCYRCIWDTTFSGCSLYCGLQYHQNVGNYVFFKSF